MASIICKLPALRAEIATQLTTLTTYDEEDFDAALSACTSPSHKSFVSYVLPTANIALDLPESPQDVLSLKEIVDLVVEPCVFTGHLGEEDSSMAAAIEFEQNTSQDLSEDRKQSSDKRPEKIVCRQQHVYKIYVKKEQESSVMPTKPRRIFLNLGCVSPPCPLKPRFNNPTRLKIMSNWTATTFVLRTLTNMRAVGFQQRVILPCVSLGRSPLFQSRALNYVNAPKNE